MQEDKVSIIIPVHNGEKYIKRTVRKILKQDYDNIEIILVENFSSDNSAYVCNELEKIDNRIIHTTSYEKGTTFARKKGIQIATGNYIFFVDQDDCYYNNKAIRKMHDAIIDDHTQICQFGNFKKKYCMIKNCQVTDKSQIFLRNNLMNYEISGIWGNPKSCFNTCVWSKIYDAKLLKSVVEKMEEKLFYAEDVYLNLLAFFSENLQSVSVHPESYYVWTCGVGYSSKADNGLVLFREYSIVKPLIFDLVGKLGGATDDILYSTHLESIYFMKGIIDKMIMTNEKAEIIINSIAELSDYNFIKSAKNYFRERNAGLWDELRFLINNTEPEEYYKYCLTHSNRNIRSKIKHLIKK